jgi:hypothetical protein
MASRGVIAFVLLTACVPPNATPPAPSSSARPPADDDVATHATTRAPIVAWPPVVMRCLQMGDSCGGSAATCRGLTSLSDDARDQAMRCFDATSCDAYDACFRAFLASHAVPPAASTNDE